jgi:hypothetical protein
MGFLDTIFKKHKGTKNKEIQELLGIIRAMADNEAVLLKELYDCQHPIKSHPVALILTFINQKNKTMAVTLNPNQSVIGALSLIDTVTGNPVVATISGATATSDTPGVATAVVNADGTITVAAVAPGTANISGGATAAYTDSNGNAQTAALTFTAVAVSVAQPAADSVGLVLTFGTPTP